MNEEELKEEIEFWEDRIKEIEKDIKPDLMVSKNTLMNYRINLSECQARLEGFQKGKLEQKKEVENIYNKIIYEDLSPEQLLGITIFFRRIMGFKQLQKEISVPEKQVQIGEEKQDE